MLSSKQFPRLLWVNSFLASTFIGDGSEEARETLMTTILGGGMPALIMSGEWTFVPGVPFKDVDGSFPQGCAFMMHWFVKWILGIDVCNSNGDFTSLKYICPIS